MAKGFKRERKRYQLTFEDGELDGFEVTANGLTLDAFIDVSALASALATPEGRTRENIEAQFVVLGGALVSWNLLDDDDNPVPCGYDGHKSQDVDFAMVIFRTWMKSMQTVPDELGKDSGSGEISPERSLGLARQSQSRAS